MAMTPEAKVKAKVKRLLDALGIWHFSPMMNGMGRAGVPDIIGCVNGRFIGIECKAGDNKATALQLRELSNIASAGGFTYIVRETNFPDLEGKLRWLVQQSTSR